MISFYRPMNRYDLRVTIYMATTRHAIFSIAKILTKYNQNGKFSDKDSIICQQTRSTGKLCAWYHVTSIQHAYVQEKWRIWSIKVFFQGRIFYIEMYCIFIKVLCNLIPKILFDLRSSPIQIMDWRWTGGNPLSKPMVSLLLNHIFVTRHSACGLRSPWFESSGVFYITSTNTSSMQELIMQGIEQKIETSCFRRKENTGHVESNYIL